jgi:hypothetical protein
MTLTERELSSDEKGDIILLLNLQDARTLADIIVTDRENRQHFYTDLDIYDLSRKHNLGFVSMNSLVHALNECRQVKEADISHIEIGGDETIDVVEICYAS